MARPVLTARFGSWAALAKQQRNVERRGLFLPAPTPLPEPLAALSLLVVVPDGRCFDLDVQVVQIAPGAGIALAFDPESPGARSLVELVWGAGAEGASSERAALDVRWGLPAPAAADGCAEAAAVVGASGDALALEPVVPARPGEEASEPSTTEEEAATEENEALRRQIHAMTTPEKMRLAMHGDRPARMMLLRDPNKTIQLFVIQNKRITIGEVLYLAGYRQANPEALARIGESRDWTAHAGVVTALVGNPKTPTPTALRLLRQLGPAELRRLAKSPSAPRAISQAAKKLVIGG